MKIKKVNIAEKLSLINDYWNPRIAGELNGQQVKLAKLHGDFVMHQHQNEDEMFLVIKGHLTMRLENETLEIAEGEFIIIPKGTMHQPVAKTEVHVLLFEPATTINTGNTQNHFTKTNLKSI